MGEERRDREIWEALLDVLTECSHLPRAEIHADTLLLVVPEETADDDRFGVDRITSAARPARGS